MSNLNNEVRLVATHLGIMGDLNDNRDFTSTIDGIMRGAKEVITLEEYFNNVTYFMKDVKGTNYMYFTATVSSSEEVDGFLIQADNPNNLFKYFQKIRHAHTPIHLISNNMVDLLEVALDEGIEVDVNDFK